MANNKTTRMAADFHDAPTDPRFAAAHYGNDLQEAGQANCQECNVIYPYHDIDCKTGRERGKANRVKATQAAPAVSDADTLGALVERAQDLSNPDPFRTTDAKDAARYRWLRAQHWNESTLFVVAGHHSLVRLGTECPSGELLDAAIDAAIAKSGA